MRISLFLSALALYFGRIAGYGTGVDTCISIPQHGSWATGCNPNNCFPVGGGGTAGGQLTYVIDVLDNTTNARVTSYIPNTDYIGILRNTNNTGGQCTQFNCFRGFVLNVGTGRINGNFETVSSNPAGIITLDPVDTNVRRMTTCNNGITHSSNNPVKNIHFQWRSPQAGTGPVTFKSVIVSSRTTANYIANLILNEGFLNITHSNTGSTSITPSTSYSSTTTRTSRPSRSPSGTSSNTNTPTVSISAGAQPSLSSSISYTSSITPSSSDSATRSVSVSQSLAPTSSITQTPEPTDSRTSSLTPNMLPSYSSSPSQSGTNTPTITSSHTSSYTAQASETSGGSPSRTALPSPSTIVSDSQTPTYSPTLGASHSATETNNPDFITIITNTEPSQSQIIANGGLGAAIGILLTLVVVGAFYVLHKKNMKRNGPHSSRNVIIMRDTEHLSINPAVGIPDMGLPRYNKNTLDTPTRRAFEPTIANRV